MLSSKQARKIANKRWQEMTPAAFRAWKKILRGRPRIYPQCPLYRAHIFVNDRCPCGYRRTQVKSKAKAGWSKA